MRYNSETVDGFIDEVEPRHREAIIKLREQARRVLSGYVESMRFNMPTYEKGDQVYAFTRQKHYFSLYVRDAELVEEYKQRLGRASFGKNCIRYRRAELIQWDVLDKFLMAAYL